MTHYGRKQLATYSKYGDGFKWCTGRSKFVKSSTSICVICKTRVRNGPKSNRLTPDHPRIG